MVAHCYGQYGGATQRDARAWFSMGSLTRDQFKLARANCSVSKWALARLFFFFRRFFDSILCGTEMMFCLGVSSSFSQRVDGLTFFFPLSTYWLYRLIWFLFSRLFVIYRTFIGFFPDTLLFKFHEVGFIAVARRYQSFFLRQWIKVSHYNRHYPLKKLHLYVRDESIFTSRRVSFIPDVVRV